MSWQNLTPQLRTRLSRLERWVGIFVAGAMCLLLFGLGYYLYQTAQRKGWFLVKAPYFTFVNSAAGMKEGDKVYLMGFEVGEIVEIEAMPPFEEANVYVAFEVHDPYYGYLWQDSRARIATGDFLGNRGIEVTKGIYGLPTYLFHELKELTLAEARALREPHGWKFNEAITDPGGSNVIAKVYAPVTETVLDQLAELGIPSIQVFNANDHRTRIMGIFDDTKGRYVEFGGELKAYYLQADESPALTDRIEQVVTRAEQALPNILQLTNRISEVLSNLSLLAQRAGEFVIQSQPVVTNLNRITTQLSAPDGSLGQWLIPDPMRQQLETALDTAQGTLQSAQAILQTTQTNLPPATSNLVVSLRNMALVTSNLNAQVQANQFILSDLSEFVRHADQTIRGLQRHWLLKGAFNSKTNQAPSSQLQPTLAPVP